MRPFEELIADNTNARAERAINALTMVMLFATEHKIVLSPDAMDRIDDIGVILLGQIRRHLNIDAAAMGAQLAAFTKHIDEHRHMLMEAQGVPRS